MSESELDDLTMEELQDWQPSDQRCPECASPTLDGKWWDDHPSNGGGCIGTARKCTSDTCDYYETE